MRIFQGFKPLKKQQTPNKLGMDGGAARRLWHDRFAQLLHLLRWQTLMQQIHDNLQSAILQATEYFGYTDQPMIELMNSMLVLVKSQIEQLFDLIVEKQVQLWMLSLRYAQLRQQTFDDL